MSLQRFSERGYIQAKVREVTSNDPWGPSGTQMYDIAQMTHNRFVRSSPSCVATPLPLIIRAQKRLR